MNVESTEFKISGHAMERWQRGRRELERELLRSVPVGGQRGGDVLLLLPCGLVAAVTEDNFVKTILSGDHAIGNMQDAGLKVEVSPDRKVPPRSARNPIAMLAARHAIDGLSKTSRNELLRDAGYDPCGRDGEMYRVAFEAASHVLLCRAGKDV